MTKKYDKQFELAEEFMAKLVDAYPQYKIPQASREAYVEFIQKANLSKEEWDKLLFYVTDNCTQWPSCAHIWDGVKAMRQLRVGITKNLAVQLFDYEGYQLARYFTMPDIPRLPDGATNARVRILDTVRPLLEDLPTKKEARAAFRECWIESGADPKKCDAMFDMIDRQARTQLADYDDRLTDDEL